MIANLISPVIHCVERVVRVVRARPRIAAATIGPAVRPVVRAAIRRAPRVIAFCTVGTLPAAALLLPLPVPPAPPPLPAAPLAGPAPLPYGIGAAGPLLPPMAFGFPSGPGGRGDVPFAGPPPPDAPPVPPPPPGGVTQVPEPGFLFATGLLALAGILIARRIRARGG